MISPFILDRLERLSFSTTGLELRLTNEIIELGAPKAAKILKRTDLPRFAESFAFVHETLADDTYKDARAHLEDTLVDRATAIARLERFDAGEVRLLHENAPPVMRVLILGLMKGDASLADGASILSSIADPRTANEQYHALVLAITNWHHLGRSDRHAIQAALRERTDIPQDSDRHPLIQEVLGLNC